MGTKKKILAGALKLFNERNTQAATTNHIAAALGMSPGNLHYHFKNREAIILRLYEEMKAQTELATEALPGSIGALHEHMLHLGRVYWEYRFFHRELLFLLSRDPELKALYVRDNLAHRERILLVLTNLVENGCLQVPYANVLEHLADTTLLATQFWIPFLETLGTPLDERNVEGMFTHVQGAMRPYLTPKGLKALADLVA
ncbi:TetR/AcrR family transcriptional regulator [Sulfurimonas sp. HSL1-6]|uniref:TetR/AcrR family transcriptional regulator n=1 Tax=Thiomicrolovo immobilis TaxID=3131935 RepID=UPI0031F8E3FF